MGAKELYELVRRGVEAACANHDVRVVGVRTTNLAANGISVFVVLAKDMKTCAFTLDVEDMGGDTASAVYNVVMKKIRGMLAE